jgi:hypothetical protein
MLKCVSKENGKNEGRKGSVEAGSDVNFWHVLLITAAAGCVVHCCCWGCKVYYCASMCGALTVCYSSILLCQYVWSPDGLLQ